MRSLCALALLAAHTSFAQQLSPTDLINAIAAAQTAGEASYNIAPGVYNFSGLFPNADIPLGPPSGHSASPFNLSAYGVTWILRPGQGLIITNATGMRMAGLTIDFDPLPFTQGVVSQVTAGPDGWVTFDLALEEGYPDLSDRNFMPEGAVAKTIFWNATTRTMYHEQVQTTSEVHNYTGRAPRVWRIASLLSISHFVPPTEGALCTVSPVITPAVQCVQCAGMLFEDITLLASSAMGYIEMGGLGGNVLRRWRNIRAPGTTRLLSTNLDGIHSTSVAAGLSLLDSEISFAADDLFAVHCELAIAWGKPDPSDQRTLYIIDTGGNQARTIAQAPPGAALDFYALNLTMDPLTPPASLIVESVVVEENATLQAQAAQASADIARELHLTIRPVADAALLTRVTFTSVLPAAVLPRFAAMVQWSGRCGHGTVVRNCSLHDTTGGMRLKGVNVTVDNVDLQRAYGMRMLPEVFWTQSISENITITNSQFVTTGNAPAAPDSIEYVNDTCRGLVLENNTFAEEAVA
jgi:hypothetical protein